MSKKILITCTDSMMKQFLEPHVLNLVNNGYTVDIACSEVLNRMDEVKADLCNVVNKLFVVDLKRNPLSLDNCKGYRELKKIINNEEYDLIWTNEPVMGVMTRLACRKARRKGSKVLYMAHGFHFYKGAPTLNWLACPIEIIMSLFNDVLVTINWEDYNWAKKSLFTKYVFHIDGIGVDFERKKITLSREAVRKEFGLSESDILILSVGELQKRKNHEPFIRAVAELNRKDIVYFICGIGYLDDHLKKLVHNLGLDGRVRFLGYRKDVANIMNAADIFAHPSLREGLGIAPLEAMALGLPIIASNVQGIPDYVENGVTGFMCNPMDVIGYKNNIMKLLDNYTLRKQIGETNRIKSRKYSIDESSREVFEIIQFSERNL